MQAISRRCAGTAGGRDYDMECGYQACPPMLAAWRWGAESGIPSAIARDGPRDRQKTKKKRNPGGLR
jgi:hypothetical protein